MNGWLLGRLVMDWRRGLAWRVLRWIVRRYEREVLDLLAAEIAADVSFLTGVPDDQREKAAYGLAGVAVWALRHAQGGTLRRGLDGRRQTADGRG